MEGIYTCIGIRSVDFKAQDGNQISGLNIWLTYEDEHIQGVGAEKVFIPSSRVPKLSFMPSVGCTCELFYNKYGKVQDIGQA